MEGGLVKTRPLRPLEAVRAFGMMLGAPIALAVSAAASIVAVVRPATPGVRAKQNRGNRGGNERMSWVLSPHLARSPPLAVSAL